MQLTLICSHFCYVSLFWARCSLSNHHVRQVEHQDALGATVEPPLSHRERGANFHETERKHITFLTRNENQVAAWVLFSIHESQC